MRDILTRADRTDDNLEFGLDAGFCYNPLHNDLDPYEVAHVIATLLATLFGRGTQPLWHQAYTDLLKFVILVRRIRGHTRLSAAHQDVINDSTAVAFRSHACACISTCIA